jgi:hypothetical protein
LTGCLSDKPENKTKQLTFTALLSGKTHYKTCCVVLFSVSYNLEFLYGTSPAPPPHIKVTIFTGKIWERGRRGDELGCKVPCTLYFLTQKTTIESKTKEIEQK